MHGSFKGSTNDKLSQVFDSRSRGGNLSEIYGSILDQSIDSDVGIIKLPIAARNTMRSSMFYNSLGNSMSSYKQPEIKDNRRSLQQSYEADKKARYSALNITLDPTNSL